jgi:hypothetical protein
MRCQLAIVVVGATLIAGLGSGIAARRSDRIEELLQIATGVGRASSTASVCREISWPRIKVLTDSFSDLIKASFPQSDEFASIQGPVEDDIERGLTSTIS